MMLFHDIDIQLSGTEYVERFGTIQLICNATGKHEPPHDVEWFKDGARVNSDAERQVSNYLTYHPSLCSNITALNQ